MAAPDRMLELVERFRRNADAYTSGAYNETQVRHEFIDPMFELLGWDVNNTKGYAEAYKDVIHEDAIRVGGTTKAPDYCFRIGGTRKFFLEAKKPSVSIKEDPSPAYQLRRYVWSAKLPLSILTNFQELALYGGRVQPEKTDKPSVARINYLTYDDYPAAWDELAGIFGRDAVLKGSFDSYAESRKGKGGTAEVDAAFLKEIERWRDLLARNIALRNPQLSVRELNVAVQRTIDRIVFLRICEDRGIETQYPLAGLLNGPNTYRRLFELFQRADERYNSGLFHFRSEKGFAEAPDELSRDLVIDDAALKDILANLYYPDSPYEFSVLPADILGQVYEQFLGKVIRLTPAHRAVVEDKPEVKKAGGVYYTPTYIVDYIVANTVGVLLEGKTPKQAAELRVLDPACGSGSFLLGAYQRLLDWHRDRYVEDGPEKHARARKGGQATLFQGPGGEWRLTTPERKRILLNSIYGVDIDPQAVEVTKLSLLLKVLEGESEQTLSSQLKLFHERALPDLASNVKCGNSLIGPDYFHGRQGGLFDEEETLRINAFDWPREFPAILGRENPGFAAVIGNPPYVRIQTLNELSPDQVRHFRDVFRAARQGSFDIYALFVELGLRLLGHRGLLGFILPHKFLNSKSGQPLRQIVEEGSHLGAVVHFADQQVFLGSTTYTCLLFLSAAASKKISVTRVTDLASWRLTGKAETGESPALSANGSEWTFSVGPGASLAERLRKWPTELSDVATRMFVGQQTSADDVYLFKTWQPAPRAGLTRVFSTALEKWVDLEDAIVRRVVRSGSIDRYSAEATALVLFPYKIAELRAELLSQDEMQRRFPLAWRSLLSNRLALREREKGKFRDEQWYRFGRSQNLGMWEQQKLLVPYMITRLAAFLDAADDYYFINVTTGGYGITLDEARVPMAYVLGLLNSRLLDFALKQVSTNFRGGYLAANKQFIERLPICVVEEADTPNRERRDRIGELAMSMQAWKVALRAAKTEHEQTVLHRQIAATDRELDQLVYELYDLTQEEIKVVEGASRE